MSAMIHLTFLNWYCLLPRPAIRIFKTLPGSQCIPGRQVNLENLADLQKPRLPVFSARHGLCSVVRRRQTLWPDAGLQFLLSGRCAPRARSASPVFTGGRPAGTGFRKRWILHLLERENAAIYAFWNSAPKTIKHTIDTTPFSWPHVFKAAQTGKVCISHHDGE
jgi:hypothetical protein